jgi:hypothetical protein
MQRPLTIYGIQGFGTGIVQPMTDKKNSNVWEGIAHWQQFRQWPSQFGVSEYFKAYWGFSVFDMGVIGDRCSAYILTSQQEGIVYAK